METDGVKIDTSQLITSVHNLLETVRVMFTETVAGMTSELFSSSLTVTSHV